jgi:SLAP domain-containing protein
MLGKSNPKYEELHNDIIEDKNIMQTKLSLLEKHENIVSEVQKEIMDEEISELEPIKENDINISTIYVFDDGQELEVKVYFRNGFSRKVNFEYLPLILVNSDGEEIARESFDLREMGDLPPKGARPWKLYFNKKLVDLEKLKKVPCNIVFDSKVMAVNYADIEYEEFEESYLELKPYFEKFLAELPRIEKEKLSMSTFDISLGLDGKIIITLVMRNSAGTDVEIQEIPITIRQNNNNNVVASGKFSMKNFTIKSMKAKICTLVFETSMETKQVVSFTDKWNIVFE